MRFLGDERKHVGGEWHISHLGVLFYKLCFLRIWTALGKKWVHIWLMSIGNWGPKASETANSLPMTTLLSSIQETAHPTESLEIILLRSPVALLGLPALPGDRFPICIPQYPEERWITHWWFRGNLKWPSNCCEILNRYFLPVYLGDT